MKLFHLSHTDLDGYSCQLVIKEYFNEGSFFNANYGLEVKLNLKRILQKIESHKEEEILFLITDLNLTFVESKELDVAINELNSNGYNIKLQLLDHHATGQKSANSYDWYFLDTLNVQQKLFMNI